MEVALEAGADDIQKVEGYWEITCDPKSFDTVKQALDGHKIATETAETSYIASNTVELDLENGKRMIRLRDILNENEDVQNIYANDNIPEEAMS